MQTATFRFLSISTTLILAYTAFALNDSNHTSQAPLATPPSSALKLRQTPSENASIISEVALGSGFEVIHSPWVEVKLTNGKKGWVQEKDIQTYLNQAYQHAYRVEVSGSQTHYQVTTLSPKESQARYKAEKARAEQRYARMQQHFQDLFFMPSFGLHSGLFEDERVSQLEEKIASLEKKLSAGK